jgi:hypothetical protein
MRRYLWLLGAVVFAGCGGADQADTAADTVQAVAPPAAPALTVADLTGTWAVNVMPQASDSVLLTYTMNATGDTSTWNIKFADRADPVPIHILSIAGDSVVMHAGPYSSALRKGKNVETHTVARVQGGTMTGTAVATYSAGPDSVVTLRFTGTKQ